MFIRIKNEIVNFTYVAAVDRIWKDGVEGVKIHYSHRQLSTTCNGITLEEVEKLIREAQTQQPVHLKF